MTDKHHDSTTGRDYYVDENGNKVDLADLVTQLDAAVSTTVNYAFVDNTGVGNSGQWIDPNQGLYTTPGIVGRTMDQYSWDTQSKVKCDHVMGDETETEDGQVVGFCTLCGDKIKGRRMVGGYGLARLKDAIVDALGDREAMAGLLDEIDRVELMLKVEEQALRSAHDMLNMAREMVEKIVLPETDDEPEAEAA